MKTPMISKRVENLMASTEIFRRYLTESARLRHANNPDVCDFVFGNPHEMPLSAITNTLQTWATPHREDWFAYKTYDRSPQEIVAASLHKRLNLAFEPDDILLTTGVFAGLATILSAIIEPDDEFIYMSPPWFLYEPHISWYGGKAIRVSCHPTTFDLDLEAIERAISPRTRGVIINSPNNPTGKIYPATTLQRLADLLTKASRDYQHPIYLLSDEAYSRIVFDGRTCPSPLQYYSHSFLLYTYGKTLLTPGQRLGYIALAPNMPDKESVAMAIFLSQIVTGYCFPNALLQHSLPDLDVLSIDVDHLQARRDRVMAALTSVGYEVYRPDGTFYMIVRSPLTDDFAFTDLLAEHHVYCLPGSTFEMPGFFRISLTSSDDMIERALPRFALAMHQAKVKSGIVD